VSNRAADAGGRVGQPGAPVNDHCSRTVGRIAEHAAGLLLQALDKNAKMLVRVRQRRQHRFGIADWF
jgi:hypothetical protein